MLEPLGDRVIIEVEEPKEKEVGGIVLANNAKEKPQTGKVVAVGTGRTLDNGEKVAPSVKKDDVVMFDKYGGTKTDFDGHHYLIMSEKDLLAVVK